MANESRNTALGAAILHAYNDEALFQTGVQQPFRTGQSGFIVLADTQHVKRPRVYIPIGHLYKGDPKTEFREMFIKHVH